MVTSLFYDVHSVFTEQYTKTFKFFSLAVYITVIKHIILQDKSFAEIFN